MLDNLSVVLFDTKYPENIGSVARACKNMGCSEIKLVKPRMWDIEKAAPLATVHSRDLLDNAQVFETLPDALTGVSRVYGTTARTGGWRKGIMTPSTAAPMIIDSLRQGEKVSIVFGPEDRGLTNEETKCCSRLMNIPTNRECTSLNLAQAVVIVLYECMKSALENPESVKGQQTERQISYEEQEILFSTMQDTLQNIDFLKPGNPEYWMMPVRRFLSRMNLRRNEFNLIMGVCRQVGWIAEKAGIKQKNTCD
ncbi:MAG: RNA methyltransferase [Desulfovibrio sp.]